MMEPMHGSLSSAQLGRKGWQLHAYVCTLWQKSPCEVVNGVVLNLRSLDVLGGFFRAKGSPEISFLPSAHSFVHVVLFILVCFET